MLGLITVNSNLEGRILFFLAVGAVAGLVLFYRGFGLLQRKRLFQDTPTCTIRSAAMGLVEVTGTATGQSTLVSPLSQLDCYFYQLTAWRCTGGFADYERWKKVAEENLSVPFFLDDGTGRLLVDPKGAQLEIPPDYSEEYGDRPVRGGYGMGSEMASAMSADAIVPDDVGHFLARHGISRSQRIKVEERCVKAGDNLFIVGTVCENARGIVETETAPRSAYLSAAAATVQREVALSSLLPASENQILARKQAPWGEEKADRAAARPAPDAPVVLMKGTNNPAFFISTHSQQEVLGELRWKVPLYIFGGPALTLFCLWNLFDRLGVL